MANNVFGAPITDETLRAMDKYKDKPTITRLERAHEALVAKHDGDKAANADLYVKQLKVDYGDGVSTLCLFYNATGDPLKYVHLNDWYGHLEKAPVPQEIGNGQWGGLLHVKPSWPNLSLSGSAAGVVFRGKNDAGQERDWMCSWHTPYNVGYSCKAYAQIREKDHFWGDDEWAALLRLTDAADHQMTEEWGGCTAVVSIGDGTTAVYEATLSLSGADHPDN